MVYELPKWAQSAMVVVVACLLMVGIVASALAIARGCRWLENYVPKLLDSRRKRKEQLAEFEPELKMFRDTLDETLEDILNGRSAETKKPFDQDGE
jgi:hypothetical protein